LAKKAFVYDGSQWVDIAQSTADLSNYANLTTTPISGFRNAIINGGMDVWQRGTSTFTAAGYTADRWRIQNSSGQTISLTRQAFTAGNPIPGYEPTNFLRFSLSGTPAGTYWFSQRVEDVRTFAGQTVTLSFWAKASSATTALAPMLEQNFGTGGSTFVQIPSSSISLTTSWQRFSATFTVPSISGKTIGAGSFLEVRPLFGSTAITGNNIDVWGVQLEVGTIATPFEQRPIGTELALCQRYYFKIFPLTAARIATGFNASTTTAIFNVYFPVEMRIAATAIEQSGTASDYAVTHGNFTITNSNSVPAYVQGSRTNASFTVGVASGLTAGQGSMLYANNSNATLAWSAEL
jgi:hypothetical protein